MLYLLYSLGNCFIHLFPSLLSTKLLCKACCVDHGTLRLLLGHLGLAQHLIQVMLETKFDIKKTYIYIIIVALYVYFKSITSSLKND